MTVVVSLYNKETNQNILLTENENYNMKVKGQPISGNPFKKQGSINVRKGLVREDIKV